MRTYIQTEVKTYDGEYGKHIEALNDALIYLLNNREEQDDRIIQELGIYLGEIGRHSC